MPEPSTKDRILDAAERLFSRHGLDASSLRLITTEAGVNLAAVNYHFQSKDALIEAVFARRINPVNQRRLCLLEAYLAAAGDGPIELEPIIRAFVQPIIEKAGNLTHFRSLIARLFLAEPEVHADALFQRYFRPVMERFAAAMRRALPDLPIDEFYCRLQFMVGAMAYSVSTSHRPSLIPGIATADLGDLLERIVPFVAAGLRAPVADPKGH